MISRVAINQVATSNKVAISGQVPIRHKVGTNSLAAINNLAGTSSLAAINKILTSRAGTSSPMDNPAINNHMERLLWAQQVLMALAR